MSELLEQIRNRSIEAVHNGDIKALYELVQDYNDELDDSVEQAIYANILELALESLTDALESKSKLSLEDEKQKYTMRALYEYAVSHYTSEKFYEARALFEVLESVAKQDEFAKSMKIHAAAARKEIDIDSFLEDFCNLDEKLDDFYVKEFKNKAQELLESVN